MSTSIGAIAPINIQTIQYKRSIGRAIVVGGATGAVCWAILIEILVWISVFDGSVFSDRLFTSYLYYALVAYPCSGALRGALVGGLAGAAGSLMGGLTGRRDVDRLIGTLVGALTGALVGQPFVTSIVLLAGNTWLITSLLLESNIVAGSVSGYIGAGPCTKVIKASCGACQGAVRPDATDCKHCGAAFGKLATTLVSPPSRTQRLLAWIERLYVKPNYQKPGHSHRH